MDNQPKCFVPDCGNEVGVLFPKNPIVRKKWLKSLGLDNLNLKIGSKSFVCLDHFEEDGQPSAIPKSRKLDNVPNNRKSGQTNRETMGRVLHQTDSKQKSDRAVIVETLKREMSKVKNTETKRFSSSIPGSPTKNEVYRKQEEQGQDNAVAKDYDHTCRLCMSQSSTEMENIFNKIDENHTIAHMITVCLHPLEISDSDKLSKNVCAKCLQNLKGYFKFHQFCLEMDATQRELINQELHSDDHYVDSDNSEEYLHIERLSDYEEDKENKDESRNEKTNGEILKSHTIDQETKINEETMPEKSAIDLKFDRVEEELAKVLEGDEKLEFKESKIRPQSQNSKSDVPNITESSDVRSQDKTVSDSNTSSEAKIKVKDEEVYTENIIIEMINDEEPSNEITPGLVIPQLPITIKRINSSMDNRKPVKKKRNNSNYCDEADQNMTMIKTNKSGNNDEVVVLPSGIKVEVREKQSSALGLFSCEPVKYAFNHEFLLAGGYLYEYWLAKSDVRHLHCIVSKCPAIAIQTRLDRNTFSNEIEVVKGHNHDIPDAPERKRQMCYSIMYGKMRRDRSFNFKLLYEQFCKLDEEIMEILPLRKVISEICKQGPLVQPPTLKTFDEFYDSIENDSFHRIHFTDNQAQFYQERFETDDGAKAVIFANQEVIDLYSYSKLMYVDASFHIESKDFPFKLLTVLLWVSESYYPILYAFVNQKSQDIYKRIFDFLYNTLAPNLRPDEIITEYEANLYYALGETYAESSIGGSIFYFTQNLYKKICSLGLAKELDSNSNFRTIYNMLLMIPLLPVNTILDGLNNIEIQAAELGLEDLTNELLIQVHNEWICKVTPEFFCVHRLENRINENIVAPFKKLRDLIMLSKSKSSKNHPINSVVNVIEKLLELDKFLRDTFNGPAKKSFSKDLSSSQKKIVLKAWNFIENHPKININHFFLKVLGYIKCMENQLWIWGFYRYEGDTNDELINASNFSIINEYIDDLEYQGHQGDTPMEEDMEDENFPMQEDEQGVIEEFYIEDSGAVRRVEGEDDSTLVENFSVTRQNMEKKVVKNHSKKEEPAVLMEAVIDENGGFVLQNTRNTAAASSTKSKFFTFK